MADISYAGQSTQPDPNLQAKQIGLLEGFQDMYYGRYEKLPDGTVRFIEPTAGQEVLPAIEAAPADYFTNEASLDLGQELREGRGIGGYKNYLDMGIDDVAQARPLFREGIQALRDSNKAYDPSDVQRYMDPYQQQVVDATMKEMNRQGNIARTQAAAGAVGAGAFGSTREGVQRAELDRGLADVKSRALADLYSRGYSQALDASRQDFANQQARQANLASGLGQFGQGFQGLGQSLQNTAQNVQGQGLADYQAFFDAGNLRRNINQQQLEADRATEMNRLMYPYQKFGFMQDAMNKVPTGMSTLTSSTTPGSNPLLQMLGTGANIAFSGAALKSAFPDMNLNPFSSNS